jgi:hypothetical protein
VAGETLHEHGDLLNKIHSRLDYIVTGVTTSSARIPTLHVKFKTLPTFRLYTPTQLHHLKRAVVAAWT